MPIPARSAFLFTADCYGQPLRIQYVDGALWFVQTDLQAVLRMRLRAPESHAGLHLNQAMVDEVRARTGCPLRVADPLPVIG